MQRFSSFLTVGLLCATMACQPDQSVTPVATPAQAPDGARMAATDPKAQGQVMLQLINSTRANQPLQTTEAFSTYAAQQAQRYANTGAQPVSGPAQYQYQGMLTASGNSSAIDVFLPWTFNFNNMVLMSSKDFQSIGVGYAENAAGKPYWVVFFYGGQVIPSTPTPPSPAPGGSTPGGSGSGSGGGSRHLAAF